MSLSSHHLMKALPIPGNQRFLFRPRPALDLTLKPQCCVFIFDWLGPNQRHRTSMMGVAGHDASVMLIEALTDRHRDSGVIGLIRTAHDVNPMFHLSCWPATPPFDFGPQKARASAQGGVAPGKSVELHSTCPTSERQGLRLSRPRSVVSLQEDQLGSTPPTTL